MGKNKAYLQKEIWKTIYDVFEVWDQHPSLDQVLQAVDERIRELCPDEW
jgi:hypothetical protein